MAYRTFLSRHTLVFGLASALLSSCGDPRDRPGTPGNGGSTGTAGTGGPGGAAGSTTGSGGRAGGGGGTGGGALGGSGGAAATLKAAATAANRLIGVALSANRLNETAYANAAREFNYVTPENEMKWDALEPTQNQFRWTGADQVVTFAMQNGMQVKGHTLVWHSQLPAWATSLNNANAVRNAMTNHITQVLNHFRGKVVSWDVVNEAIDDNGTALRASIFSQYLGNQCTTAAGPCFLDEAFQTARSVDSTILLYYNDYGTEGTFAKANYQHQMLQAMKSRGVPIDGVGLQMHTGAPNMWPSISELQQNMTRLAALGLDVLISEVDIYICTSDVNAQRTRYHDLVAACLGQAACPAITVWGITDKYSWLNGDMCATPRPLLWDDNYNKKPAYSGVMDALLGR